MFTLNADQSIFESLKSDFDGFYCFVHSWIWSSFVFIHGRKHKQTNTKTQHGCIDERVLECMRTNWVVRWTHRIRRLIIVSNVFIQFGFFFSLLFCYLCAGIHISYFKLMPLMLNHIYSNDQKGETSNESRKQKKSPKNTFHFECN